jgi:hypothetical protein
LEIIQSPIKTNRRAIKTNRKGGGGDNKNFETQKCEDG